MNEKLKSAITLMLGVVLAIIISEGTMQLLNFPPRPVSGWLDCKDKNPGECNSMGFRGAEISYSDEDFIVMGYFEVYAAAFPFS